MTRVLVDLAMMLATVARPLPTRGTFVLREGMTDHFAKVVWDGLRGSGSSSVTAAV
jgi:hypothetical protein